MDFVCTLEWLGQNRSVLAKAVLELHEANLLLKSQRLENAASGKIFVHLSGQAVKAKSIQQVELALRSMKNFSLINLLKGQSMDLLERALDRQGALKEIAKSYPDITATISVYANTLAPESRRDELFSIGEAVGASVYKRDYALGNALPTATSLSRELVPALKAFSPIALVDSNIEMKSCPFCAQQNNSHGHCIFFAGFIKGFLDKNPVATVNTVQQTRCGGAVSSCVFNIT